MLTKNILPFINLLRFHWILLSKMLLLPFKLLSLVQRVNVLVIHVYHFLKLYCIHHFNNTRSLPLIDTKFVMLNRDCRDVIDWICRFNSCVICVFDCIDIKIKQNAQCITMKEGDSMMTKKRKIE